MNTTALRMRKCMLSGLVVRLCQWRYLRKLLIPWVLKLEGGEYCSVTWRKVLLLYNGLKVGNYSYGRVLTTGGFPAGVEIGRYVSIGPEVKVFLRNHPLERISMHPFFYNQKLGLVNKDNISSSTLTVGHDVWIGARAIITPGCCKIGTGAVVGAGAVVTKNIPPFAVVAGNPATIIRYRFTEDDQKHILASCWWEKSISEISTDIDSMVIPFHSVASPYPLLKDSEIYDVKNCNES